MITLDARRNAACRAIQLLANARAGTRSDTAGLGRIASPVNKAPPKLQVMHMRNMQASTPTGGTGKSERRERALGGGRMSLRRVLAPLLCAALSMPACAFAGEIHKWVDEQGRTHFGDRPPAGRDATTVKLKRADADPARAPGASQAGGAASTQSATKDKKERVLRALERAREDRQREADEKKAALALRREECTKARDELERVKDARALVRKKDDGTREYLTEAERQDYERRARDRIGTLCS